MRCFHIKRIVDDKEAIVWELCKRLLEQIKALENQIINYRKNSNE